MKEKVKHKMHLKQNLFTQVNPINLINSCWIKVNQQKWIIKRNHNELKSVYYNVEVLATAYG